MKEAGNSESKNHTHLVVLTNTDHEIVFLLLSMNYFINDRVNDCKVH